MVVNLHIIMTLRWFTLQGCSNGQAEHDHFYRKTTPYQVNHACALGATVHVRMLRMHICQVKNTHTGT